MERPTAEQTGTASGASRLLLTALGTRADEASYRLGGRTVSARLAPVALLELLDEPVECVLAVCTEAAAAATLPLLEESLAGKGQGVEVIRVPEALTTTELAGFVEEVTRAVVARRLPGGTRVSVDLTHGFRHHAVLLWAAALYLASLEQLDVEHVWYAPLGTGAEVLDLQPLLLLPQLVHAVQELRATGSARSLADLVGREARQGREARRGLEALTRAVVAGLPLEAGMKAEALLAAGRRQAHRAPEARQLRSVLRRLEVPLGEELVHDLVELLNPLRVMGAKSDVALDDDELGRQARLIELLLGWESMHVAIGLMREWTVSWAVWATQGGGPVPGDRWLHERHRRPVERALNALRLYVADGDLRGLLGPEHLQLADFWCRLGNLRNAYMHFAMQPLEVDPARAVGGSRFHRDWPEVRRYWWELARRLPCIDLGVAGGAGHVLVSPLGLSPGVLTNAVRHARKACGGRLDHVVVICSPESRRLADDALAHAGWCGPVLYRTLADPFAEVRAMLPKDTRRLPDDPELRKLVASAAEVSVNLTGGTTAMTIVAQQVAEAALAFDRPVRRFALVDRRTAEEQQRDPWAPCEAVFLDGGGATAEA